MTARLCTRIALFFLVVTIVGLAFKAYGRADLQALWQLAYTLCH